MLQSKNGLSMWEYFFLQHLCTPPIFRSEKRVRAQTSLTFESHSLLTIWDLPLFYSVHFFFFLRCSQSFFRDNAQTRQQNHSKKYHLIILIDCSGRDNHSHTIDRNENKRHSHIRKEIENTASEYIDNIHTGKREIQSTGIEYKQQAIRGI